MKLTKASVWGVAILRHVWSRTQEGISVKAVKSTWSLAFRNFFSWG
ncbi:MAG TPA: hypothetical protein VJC07_02160 [Candidatus Nanoarchaeia archaeon]|nr:hypothetical protein [Candidatus Nanoarchaeia archaeon]